MQGRVGGGECLIMCVRKIAARVNIYGSELCYDVWFGD